MELSDVTAEGESATPRTRGNRGWQVAKVQAVKSETRTVKSFALLPEIWHPFRAGQHIDVRLTAPNGYQAQRSYSIASAPEQDGKLEITIELLDDGEVSPYFHEVVEVGDEIEIRGPIGGPFTWRAGESDALLLVAGGSGIVPLMSMLRHREAKRASETPAVLLYSTRTAEDIIYREALGSLTSIDPNLTVVNTLTRQQPPGWRGYNRRVDAAMIQDSIAALTEDSDLSLDQIRCYICGPTDFVEAVASFAVTSGFQAAEVRTERFGPTGT